MGVLRCFKGGVFVLVGLSACTDPLFHSLPPVSELDVGDRVAPNVIEAFEAEGIAVDTIELRWRAPGDDGSQGQVTRYDIGYLQTQDSAEVINAVFDDLNPVAFEDPTAAAGQTETFQVGPLAIDTSYCFTVLAEDDVGNTSARSAVVCATTVDTIAPGPPTGLSITVDPAGATLGLSWTNATDADLDGVVLLRSDAAIVDTPTNGAAAAVGDTIGASSVVFAGDATATSFDDTGLQNGTEQFYALFSRDNADLYSTAVTASATPLDTTPPDPVTQLMTQPGNIGEPVQLDWVLPTDIDALSVLLLRGDGLPPDTPPTDGTDYGSITNLGNATVIILDPAVSGYVDTATVAGIDYFYDVRTVDPSLNYSAAESTTGTVVQDPDAPLFGNIQVTPTTTATTNDALVISFDVDRPLIANPTVDVDGNSATFASETNLSYTYDYTVAGTEIQGQRLFLIRGDSLAGVEGSDSTPIFFDFSPPAWNAINVNNGAGGFVGASYSFTANFVDISAVTGCEFCETTDGTCDSAPEWASGTISGVEPNFSCLSTTTTCADGSTLTFSMRATDPFGLTGETTPITRECDLQPPALTTINAIGEVNGYVGAAFSAEGTFSDDVDIVSCSYSVGGTGFVSGTATPPSTCASGAIFCASHGDTITINMQATDQLGNGPNPGTAQNFECDLEGPVSAALVNTAGISATHASANYSFESTLTDTESGLVSCEVCVSEGGNCSTEPQWSPGNLNAGVCSTSGTCTTDTATVTLGVRGTDALGNRGIEVIETRTCDLSAPTGATVEVFNADGVAPNDTGYAPSPMEVRGNGFTDAAGVDTCEICVASDGTCDTEWQTGTLSNGDCSLAGITCTDGQALSIAARATDEVGNGPGETAIETRTCDAAAPSEPTSLTVVSADDTTASLSFGSSTDLGSGILEYVVDVAGDPSFATPTTTTYATNPPGSHDLTGLTECERTFVRVIARDNAGNDSTAAITTFRTECGTASLTLIDGQVPNITPARELLAADIDLDGLTDVLAATTDFPLVFLRNTGAGLTSADTTTQDTCLERGLAAGDFDADGWTDVAVASSCSDVVEIFINAGPSSNWFPDTATFTYSFPASEPLSIETGDFNSDGILDLAVALTADGDFVLLLGDGTGGRGDGQFTAQPVSSVDTSLDDLVIADLDEDGILDLLMGSDDGALQDLHIEIGSGIDGRGDGSFIFGGDNILGDPAREILVGDFNDDAIDDAIVLRENDNTIEIFQGNGVDGNGFGNLNSSANENLTGAVSLLSITSLAFTPDGITDLAIGYDGGLEIWSGDEAFGWADGRFSNVGALTGLTNVYSIVRLDLNSNSFPDLVFVNGNDVAWSTISGFGRQANGALFGNVELSAASGRDVRDADVGDFNSDGIPDIVTATDSGVFAHLGQGTRGHAWGTFGDSVTVTSTPATAVTVSDYDEDGIDDVLYASATGPNVGIVTGEGSNGRGDGTFDSFAPTRTVDSGPAGFAIGDFNDDAITDAAVVCEAFGNVRIRYGGGFSGQGNGTFQGSPSPGTTVGTSPVAIVMGDFNSDTILDLATADSGSNQVSILLGLGTDGIATGSFASAVSVVVPNSPQSVAVGDFDGDRIQDLVVAGSSGGTYFLRGGGGGGRGNATFSAGSVDAGNAVAAAVGDMNGDRIADIVTVSGTANEVTILTGGGANGQGNGTWANPTALPIGGSGAAVAIHDLDLDGAPDLLVSHSQGVSILFGQGTRVP